MLHVTAHTDLEKSLVRDIFHRKSAHPVVRSGRMEGLVLTLVARNPSL